MFDEEMSRVPEMNGACAERAQKGLQCGEAGEDFQKDVKGWFLSGGLMNE